MVRVRAGRARVPDQRLDRAVEAVPARAPDPGALQRPVGGPDRVAVLHRGRKPAPGRAGLVQVSRTVEKCHAGIHRKPPFPFDCWFPLADPEGRDGGGDTSPFGGCVPRPHPVLSPRNRQVQLLSGGSAALGEPDAEAGGGELQQHRTGRHQGRDLGRAQLLQLGQDGSVSVRALTARAAQRDRVGPDLLARLAQEPLRAEPVERPQQPVHQGARPGDLGQLVVLGGDPGGEHGVDGPVIGLAAGQQRRVAELLVGDHRDQGLRQVVVDVGVHAEQHMPERGQAGGAPNAMAQGRAGSRPASAASRASR